MLLTENGRVWTKTFKTPVLMQAHFKGRIELDYRYDFEKLHEYIFFSLGKKFIRKCAIILCVHIQY